MRLCYTENNEHQWEKESVNVLDSAWGSGDIGRFVTELGLKFSDKLVPAFSTWKN